MTQFPGVQVKFENVTAATEYRFREVVSVEWNYTYAKSLMASQSTGAGQKQIAITINGLIKVYGNPADNVAAQQAVETALLAVGTGTLSYTGATDATDVRFVSLDFDEYRGSPVATFKANFITEVGNAHAHIIVTVGGLDLTIAEGFEAPKVTDSLGVQGKDEQMLNTAKRSFDISGRMVGTITEVNASQAALVAAIENKNEVTIVIGQAQGGISMNARPRSLSFKSESVRGGYVARDYACKFETHDDYTKEPYTLGEAQLTIAGITLDIVTSQKPTLKYEKTGAFYTVIEEGLSVGGKKYYVDYTAYQADVDLYNPFTPGANAVISSSTNNNLELESINISSFVRDGNYPVSGNKRYSATFSTQFKWQKDETNMNQVVLGTYLGITWNRISNTTHGFSVDDVGSVTSRSVSVTGQLLDGGLAQAKSLLGTGVTINDPAILGAGTNDYYITSLNINKTTLNNLAGGLFKVHEVSISASQLKTDSQLNYFLATTFVGNGSPLFFDKVTNQSQSTSNRYSIEDTAFIATSMNFSLSGEIWEQDSGNAPGNPNRGRDFFRLFDSGQTSAVTASAPAVYAAGTPGQFLPINYSFFVSSMSFGDWSPFVKKNDPNKGAAYWKQTISLSATVSFESTSGGGSNEPETVDTTSYIVGGQTTKFVELAVLGQGTVFKAVGVNPATAQTTVQRAYATAALLKLANPQPSPAPGSQNPPSGFAFGAGDREETKDTFEVRGLTARWIKSWKATKEE